jgi:hypothetical protein
MNTPRTDAFFRQESLREPDKYPAAKFARELEIELHEMRQAMSQVATNLGNGSFATIDASHHWMTKEVPEEVMLYCNRLRAELQTERDKVEKLKDALRNAMGHISEGHQHWIDAANALNQTK